MDDGTVYVCGLDGCPHKVRRKAAMLKHRNSEVHQILDSPLQCCGRYFQTRYLARKHHNLNHKLGGKIVFNCVICQITFSSKRKLNFHWKTIHSALSNVPHGRIKCRRCGQELKLAANLNRHLRSDSCRIRQRRQGQNGDARKGLLHNFPRHHHQQQWNVGGGNLLHADLTSASGNPPPPTDSVLLPREEHILLEDTTALKEEIIFENEELDLSYSDEEKKLRDAQDILWEDDYFQLYKTCPWQLPPSSSPPVGTNSLIHRWDPTRDLINKKEPGSFPLWDQLQVEEDVNLSSSSETSLDSRNMGKSDVAKTVFLDHSYCCPDADEIEESESWNLESPLETISSSCFEISSPLFDPDLLLETIESNYEDDFFKLSEDPKAHDCPSNVQVDEMSRSSTKALIHGQDEFLEDSEGTEQNCQPDVRVVDPDVVPDLACNETLDVTLESFISSPSMSCCPLL